MDSTLLIGHRQGFPLDDKKHFEGLSKIEDC
jgi:hypothetical protein